MIRRMTYGSLIEVSNGYIKRSAYFLSRCASVGGMFAVSDRKILCAAFAFERQSVLCFLFGEAVRNLRGDDGGVGDFSSNNDSYACTLSSCRFIELARFERSLINSSKARVYWQYFRRIELENSSY